MILRSALILLLLTCLALSDGLYQRVVHTTDPEAQCIDGSPPVVYYHEGGDRTKFLVFFVGGGLCSGMTL